MQTNPVDYRFILPADIESAGIDVSTTRIMPILAHEKRRWDDPCVLLAEDPLFLVEAAQERIGGMQQAYRLPTLATCYDRLASVAGAMHTAANQPRTWMKETYTVPSDIAPNWRYRDPLGERFSDDTNYSDAFGVSVESDAAWFLARPPYVADRVRGLYRDLRKFRRRLVPVTDGVDYSRLSKSHTNGAHPTAPDAGGVIYSWTSSKADGRDKMTSQASSWARAPFIRLPDDLAALDASFVPLVSYATWYVRHYYDPMFPDVNPPGRVDTGECVIAFWGTAQRSGNELRLRPDYVSPDIVTGQTGTVGAGDHFLRRWRQLNASFTDDPPAESEDGWTNSMTVELNVPYLLVVPNLRTDLSAWLDASGNII